MPIKAPSFSTITHNKHPATPTVQAPKKLPDYAPAGSSYNGAGKLINKQGQLLNNKGQAVDAKGYLINANNQRINAQGQLVNKQGHAINDKGKLINDKGQLVNTHGKLVNDANHLVDENGRLVNSAGRLVDVKGQLVDRDGKLVNREGYLVDKIGRPLDKNGRVALDLTSAVKGNNEPHPQLFPPKITAGIAQWQGKVPPPAPTPTLTIPEAVARMADAHSMVKAGIIPVAPSAANIARDAAISSAITGVISAPLNIAAYAGSTASAEKIKASYLPAPLVTAAPGAKPLVESAPSEPATGVEKLYPRLDEAQVTAFTVTNQSMVLKFGDTGSALLPDQYWPKDPLARINQLENLLAHAEEHTKEVANEYEVFFKPYLGDQKAAEGLDGVEVRLGAVDKRIAAVHKAQASILKEMALRIPETE
ncbi:hypothetical protein [Pseudomonas sp. B22129]|uniref:hypothetical protein n=1 Tax=Pseudomonas sp. B22129 TaxID=3235111 RepID=UPI0037852B30